MKLMNVVEEAKEKSLNLLKELSTDRGFIASSSEFANYKRIWARDSAVASLAAFASGDNELIETAKKSIETLIATQDETGRVASNTSFDLNSVSYGTTVGRIDSTLWFVVIFSQCVLRTGDTAFLKTHRGAVEKALFYLQCLELNGKDLIFIPQGADWADEYIHEGYILYDQVLYYLALKGAGELFSDNTLLKEKAEKLRNRILVNYFPKENNRNNPSVYSSGIFENSFKKYKSPLPIASFTPHSIEYRVDNFANSLLVLSDILSQEQADEIKQEIFKRYLSSGEKNILPAFDPVIQEGEESWNRLRSNYLFEFRNNPFEYHNGGLWPLVTGFFLSSLKGDQQSLAVTGFAEVLKRDGYIFPEFYNSKTYDFGGIENHAFTASAYLIAYYSWKDDKQIFL